MNFSDLTGRNPGAATMAGAGISVGATTGSGVTIGTIVGGVAAGISTAVVAIGFVLAFPDTVGEGSDVIPLPVYPDEEELLDETLIPPLVVPGIGNYCPVPQPLQYSEHTKGKRKSAKEKHQKGHARKKKDRPGGEKGDARRPYRGKS